MERHSLHLLFLILLVFQFVTTLSRELAISRAAPLSKSFQSTEALPSKQITLFKGLGVFFERN